MTLRGFQFALRSLLRRTRGLCIACGHEQQRHDRYCGHCRQHPHMCHWCCKNITYGKIYGG